jgi:beta-lactamase regulating signal transducer with metallopeptidase domain
LSSVEMMIMLWWLAQNTMVAGALAGIVALICRWARPSPAIRHALWLVVLIKLVAPPLVYWPWSADNIWRPNSQRLFEDSSDNSNQSAEQQPTETAVAPPPTDLVQPPAVNIILIPVMPEDAAQLSAVSLAPSPVPTNEPTSEPVEFESPGPAWGMSNSAESLIFQAWLVGALAMAIWQLARLARFRQKLADGSAPPPSMSNQVDELALVLGIQQPEIVVMPGISSPMIWGLGRPRLIWPEGLLDHLPESSRQCVLLHELAHLRRRDHWVSWVQLAGSCLNWWNPLFWFVNRQVRENAELACDAWVVSTLPDGRRAYAEALIEVAQMMCQADAPAPALSLGAGRRREFERRLIMIMGAGIPCKLSLRGLVVVSLLALAALPGWSQDPVPAQPAVPAPAAVPTGPGGLTPPVAVPPPPAAPLLPTSAPLISDVPLPPGAPTLAGPGAFGPSMMPIQGDAGDADARLRAIEQQLQALLKEVKGMRNAGTARTTTAVPARPGMPPRGQYDTPSVTTVPPRQPGIRAVMPPAAATSSEASVTLSRATYELSNDKSKSLSDLVAGIPYDRGYKGPEVTLKIEGDKVTVTTTPEAQQVIGQFIHFLQGKPISPHTYYVPVTSYQAVPATR